MSTSTVKLQPVTEQGWLMGFSNLFHKESGRWWRTRRWWVSTLIWLCIVNGLILGVWSSPDGSTSPIYGSFETQDAATAQDPKDIQSLAVFFIIGGMASAVGVTVVGLGAVLDDRKAGTLAWVLSKPVSRSAVLLSKLTANGVATLANMVVVQGIVAFILISLERGAPLPVIPFVIADGMMGLYILFFLTLTMMLGLLLDNRGRVLGIALILNLGSQFFARFGPADFLPHRLILPADASHPALALVIANQQPLSTIMPLIATIAWITLFVIVAIWKIRQMEF